MRNLPWFLPDGTDALSFAPSLNSRPVQVLLSGLMVRSIPPMYQLSGTPSRRCVACAAGCFQELRQTFFRRRLLPEAGR
jgi:hypothetical protein